MVLLRSLTLLLAAVSSISIDQHTVEHVDENVGEHEEVKDWTTDSGEYGGYNSSESLKKIMLEQKGEFDQNLFDLMLTRKDISHLLLSDVYTLVEQIQREFPEIVNVRSIGKSWQSRDIMVIELDARDLMEKKGLQLTQVNNTEIKDSYAEKKNPDDEDDELNGGVHLSAKAGFTLVQTKESLNLNVMTQNSVQQKIKSMVRSGDNDPMFLSDAVNTQTKDDEEKKSDEPQKEAEKSEVKKSEDNSEKTEAVEEKKPEAAGVSMSDFLKPSGEQKPVEDDSKNLEEESKRLDEELKKSKKSESAQKSMPQFDAAKQDNEDAQALMEQTADKAEKEDTEQKKKGKHTTSKKVNIEAKPSSGAGLLMTGATHARELLSMQVPLMECLKLIHNGYIHKNEKYMQMLRDQKFYFIPVVNVDGAALVEEHWGSEKKILNKRKNMNPNLDMCGDENSGVDLNRNWGIDWQPLDSKNHTELCGDYWPGAEAFSEPESKAIRDFIAAERNTIKFVINCHTSGNQFIWPFNGIDHNDIETRAPGMLQVFKDISENAHFPEGTMKGNAFEVIGDVMGGDADDYVLGTFGIPSITAEMGFFGQFIKDWTCQSKGVCFEILKDNSQWIEYIMSHMSTIGSQVHPK